MASAEERARAEARETALALVLLMVLLGGAVWGLPVSGDPFQAGIGWATAAVLLAGYLLFASGAAQRRAQGWATGRVRPFLAPLVVWFLYLLCAAAQGRLGWRTAGLSFVFLMTPAVAYVWRRPVPQRFTWQDLVALLAVWLPIELGWWPDVKVPTPGPGAPTLGPVAMIPVMLWLLLGVRPLRDLGYTFAIGWRDLLVAVGCFAGFAVIGLPLGLWTEFIHLHPAKGGAGEMLSGALSIFFFVALTEELFFRGAVQNLLSKSLGGARGGAWWALAIAAVFFGLTHSNERDWHYVVLATIAGAFYGLAYVRTRKVVPAALVHLAVGWVWVMYF